MVFPQHKDKPFLFYLLYQKLNIIKTKLLKRKKKKKYIYFLQTNILRKKCKSLRNEPHWFTILTRPELVRINRVWIRPKAISAACSIRSALTQSSSSSRGEIGGHQRHTHLILNMCKVATIKMTKIEKYLFYYYHK